MTRPWTLRLAGRSMSTFRQLLQPGAAAECVDSANNCNVIDHPGGVYTVLRSIDSGRRLVEIDTHIRRLVTSAGSKFGAEFSDDAARALQDGFLGLLCAAGPSLAPSEADRRYTVVVDRAGGVAGQFHLLCSSDAIPAPPASGEVDVLYLRRPDPQTKSVAWALQREEAEQLKRPSSNDVVIADEGGRLYEGLSSNFAVLDRGNRLITAPTTDVLCGTIMEVVKLVARELGIEVVEDFPLLSELGSYEGCFLTSTSRLVLPIVAMRLPNGVESVFLYDPEDKASKLNMIKELVRQKVIARAAIVDCTTRS